MSEIKNTIENRVTGIVQIDDTKKSNINDACEVASEMYLQYSLKHEADKQGYSQDIIGVLRCTPKVTENGKELYELEVNKPLKSKEFILRDKHHKKEYIANRDFHVPMYDRQNHLVFIRFNDPKLLLDTGERPNLELSFDLRILIMNQKEVYRNHSMDIARPVKKPKVETPTGLQYVQTFEHPNLPALNEEQKLAVHTILTNPQSKIEGPPGAGKTTMLAHVIISYMAQGLPVALITNTQVALERAMSATVDIGKDVQLDINRMIKLGHSSPWYAKEYPETLESCSFKEHLINERLDVYLLEVALQYRSMKAKIDQREEVIFLETLMKDLEENVSTLDKRQLAPQEQKNLHKMIEMKISHIQSMVKTTKLRDITGDINYKNFKEKLQLFLHYVQEMKEEIVDEPLSEDEKDMLRIQKLDITSYSSRSELYEELLGTKYDHLSEKDITQKITEINLEIAKFIRDYAKSKFDQAYLIGMTADTYNSRFKEDALPVHHIFIDEGGYMPVNKAYGMCRKNIPLCILGDSMQLPPVAEMSSMITEDGEFEEMLLYDMNAFYLDTLFDEGYEGLKRAYFKKLPPVNSIPRVELTQTYRFEDKLATILNKHVYKNEFRSAIDDGDFRLEYMDAVNEEIPKEKRENPAEAEAIRSLLASSTIGDDFVILTPYKGQVSSLLQTLKGKVNPNQVMSIHRSQGQEWDTVIISVVDFMSSGSHGMWFTNSKNDMSKGLKVINTAVSRTKKRLILVGHSRFWKAQEGQLLGDLFLNGVQIELN